MKKNGQYFDLWSADDENLDNKIIEKVSIDSNLSTSDSDGSNDVMDRSKSINYKIKYLKERSKRKSLEKTVDQLRQELSKLSVQLSPLSDTEQIANTKANSNRIKSEVSAEWEALASEEKLRRQQKVRSVRRAASRRLSINCNSSNVSIISPSNEEIIKPALSNGTVLEEDYSSSIELLHTVDIDKNLAVGYIGPLICDDNKSRNSEIVLRNTDLNIINTKNNHINMDTKLIKECEPTVALPVENDCVNWNELAAQERLRRSTARTKYATRNKMCNIKSATASATVVAETSEEHSLIGFSSKLLSMVESVGNSTNNSACNNIGFGGHNVNKGNNDPDKPISCKSKHIITANKVNHQKLLFSYESASSSDCDTKDEKYNECNTISAGANNITVSTNTITVCANNNTVVHNIPSETATVRLSNDNHRHHHTKTTPSTTVDDVEQQQQQQHMIDQRLRYWARGKDIYELLCTLTTVPISPAAAEILLQEETFAAIEILRKSKDLVVIRKTYLKIIRCCHPDKTANCVDLQSTVGAATELQKVFTILSHSYNQFKNNNSL